MKKALLLLVCAFIALCFSIYILDINIVEVLSFSDEPAKTPKTEQSNKQQDVSAAPVVVTKDGWMLVWEDDFDRPGLNMETWTEVDRKDNYNHELQYYTPLNSYVRNGRLYLTAKREDKSGKRYTSAMVETKGKCSIQTGRIEVKARMPAGQGLFPAIWMMSYSGDTEVDIMEMIGSEPDMVYAVNHYHTAGKPEKTYDTTKTNSTDGFHVYALEWEEDELRWYVDGKMFHHTKRGVPDEKMYLILTLAVGGNWPGSPEDDSIFPRSMVVEYVRYYRRIPKSTGASGESAGETGDDLTTKKDTAGI